MYTDERKRQINRRRRNRGKRRFFFLPFMDNYRILSELEKLYFKFLNIDLTIAFIYIILGVILCFANLSDSIVKVILILSYFATGIWQIFSSFQKEKIEFFNFYLYYGIISCVIGLIAIFIPGINISLGIFLIASCISKVDYVIRFKKMDEQCWNFFLLTGALLLFISIIIMINPFKNLSFMEMMGAFLILIGILNSADVFMLKTRSEFFMESE